MIKLTLILASAGAICLVAPVHAKSSDPARCVAVYGALAKEQETMLKAGASAVPTVASNYEKISYTARFEKLNTRYAENAEIKFGIMAGGSKIGDVQANYYTLLVAADGAGDFDADTLMILMLAAKCDKDEDFKPALALK